MSSGEFIFNAQPDRQKALQGIVAELIDVSLGSLITEPTVMRQIIVGEDRELDIDPGEGMYGEHYSVHEYFFGSKQELEAIKNRPKVFIDDTDYVRCPPGIIDNGY